MGEHIYVGSFSSFVEPKVHFSLFVGVVGTTIKGGIMNYLCIRFERNATGSFLDHYIEIPEHVSMFQVAQCSNVVAEDVRAELFPEWEIVTHFISEEVPVIKE